MNNTDFKAVNCTNDCTNAPGPRNSAEENRSSALETSNDAEKPAATTVKHNSSGEKYTNAPKESSNTDDGTSNDVVINLAQINIQNIVYADRSSYNNGHFIPVFQDAIRALACNQNVKPGTRRVLDYIIGTVDENNCFYEELGDIAKNLGCSDDTVERAIKQLVSMHIICKKEGARDRSLYELSDKILNPRFAYKGNTRKLRKDNMPILLDPKTSALLIPSVFDNPDF